MKTAIYGVALVFCLFLTSKLSSQGESEIEVGNETYLPSSWSEPSVAVTNGTYVVTPPKPELEKTQLGIRQKTLRSSISEKIIIPPFPETITFLDSEKASDDKLKLTFKDMRSGKLFYVIYPGGITVQDKNGKIIDMYKVTSVLEDGITLLDSKRRKYTVKKSFDKWK